MSIEAIRAAKAKVTAADEAVSHADADLEAAHDALRDAESGLRYAREKLDAIAEGPSASFAELFERLIASEDAWGRTFDTEVCVTQGHALLLTTRDVPPPPPESSDGRGGSMTHESIAKVVSAADGPLVSMPVGKLSALVVAEEKDHLIEIDGVTFSAKLVRRWAYAAALVAQDSAVSVRTNGDRGALVLIGNSWRCFVMPKRRGVAADAEAVRAA